jgi:hypothetical protein
MLQSRVGKELGIDGSAGRIEAVHGLHGHGFRHNADCRIMPTGICRVTRDPADRARSSLADAA